MSDESYRSRLEAMARRISDATPQIAEQQFRTFEELDELSYGDVLRLDTTRVP